MQDLLAHLPSESLNGLIVLLADSERLTVALLDDALATLPRQSPIRDQMGAQMEEERAHARVMSEVAASLGEADIALVDPVARHVRQLRAELADPHVGTINSLLRTIEAYERFGAITYRWVSEDPRLAPDLRLILGQIAEDEARHIDLYDTSEGPGSEAVAVRNVIGAVLDQVVLQGLELHTAGTAVPDGILPGALGLFGQPRGGYRPLTVRYDFESAPHVAATYADGGATLARPELEPDVVVSVRHGEVNTQLRAMRSRRTVLIHAALRARAQPWHLLQFLRWGRRLARFIRETDSVNSI